MIEPYKDVKVSGEDQKKLTRFLEQFTVKEHASIKNNPKDLLYAAKLIEHYHALQETGGHLVKLFQPGLLGIDKYPHHKAFFDATKTYKQALFRAANRVGKSEAGAYCTTCWATGEYPDWWEGRVFEYPTYGWACGDTNDTVRTILQAKYLGSPIGTGLIPKKNIEDVVIRPNTGGTVDTIFVKNRYNREKFSQIKFKTYQSGAESFYGKDCDWVWLDEEPNGAQSQLIWNQAYTRLLTTQGNMIVTFTPLMGWTPILKDYCENANDLTPED